MATLVEEKKPEFREFTKDGVMRIRLHPGQVRAWDSEKRIIAMICGSQGGKTVLGAHWLEREIRRRGPGDYLAVTSSYPLLSKKMLPEFRYVFEDIHHYGVYNKLDKIFIFNQEKKNPWDRILFPDADEPTRVIIGSAQNPESLEAATIKGGWLDECGQKDFKREAWEACERRGTIHKARYLLTTTVYCLGWLKMEIYDPWVKGSPDIEVVQFDSNLNPAFSEEEFERLRVKMPSWKFDMQHRGRFSRPAGLIYDKLDSAHIIPPRELPEDWPRYVGHDFGVHNTAGIWKAYDQKTGDVYTYREYLKGNLSTFEHVSNFIEMSKDERIAIRVGGAAGEEGWRGDFTQAGWRIEKPMIGDVEAGIQKVYGLEALGKHWVFNTCLHYIDEKTTYSRELNESYQPTEKIENKEEFHLMDAERYITGNLRTASVGGSKGPQVWRWD